MVFFERQLGASGARCAVVGRDDEDRPVEPRPFARLLQEAAQRIVGVHHPSGARFRIVRNSDLSRRIGEGPVIAHGHQMGEEGFAAAGVFVQRPQRLGVGILVAYAPDVGERDLLGGVLTLVHDVVAVAREEGLHVVEIAVAAVEILYGVAFFAQHGPRGVHAGVVLPLDDALAGAGRERQRDGLQSAYGAVTRGEEPFEGQPLPVQGVECRREVASVAEMLQIAGAHALDGDEHDVAPQLVRRAGDRAAVVLRAAVDAVDDGSGLGVGQSGVELLVVQFVFDERIVELVGAVGLEFVDVDVLVLLEPRAEREGARRQQQGCGVGGGGHGLPLHAEQLVGAPQLAAEQEPAQQERRQQHAREDGHHGIGFADVADDFVGVDQIVDGDEVVAHAEFAPEEVFTHGVEDDAAHVAGEQHGEPHGGPAASEPLAEEPQGEARGPIARQGGGDGRHDAAVFVEDRVEAADVEEQPRQHRQDEIAPGFAVLAFREAHREEPQEEESDGQGAQVVHGAQQEDLEPFAGGEVQVGGLFVEEQHDADRRADGDRQQGEFEIDAQEQREALFHGGEGFESVCRSVDRGGCAPRFRAAASGRCPAP